MSDLQNLMYLSIVLGFIEQAATVIGAAALVGLALKK